MFDATADVKGPEGAAVELHCPFHVCVEGFDDAEKGDASVVVAVAPLSLVLEECDDLGVPHVLWNSSFLPTLTEEYMQRMQ